MREHSAIDSGFTGLGDVLAAALVMAPVFERGKLESGIRWSLVGYGALSLIGTLGYAMDSNLFLAGFLAWGLMLFVVTGLLAVWFRAAARRLR